jgi:SAM-dependent methyltransferase
MVDVKQQVQEFYNQVGWQEVREGIYQNARYEDLRPVSRDYIHHCHLRILRFLRPQGRFLLDAGSGPIQYEEYLEYSRGYQRRVCADISLVALKEARRRIGAHGLFVVADIANLPFKPDAFDGVVSLHTIHHLPAVEHERAYFELYRVLAQGGAAAVVNGWASTPLTKLMNWLIRLVEGLYQLKQRPQKRAIPDQEEILDAPVKAEAQRKGTYVRKHDAAWLKKIVGGQIPLQIWVWRSINVRFLRTFVHEQWGGRRFLRLILWLEERFPHFLGEYGQYPLIVMRKE